MTVAPARKKSAAYEQGLREGRADKAKKPSIEIEINPEGEEESPEPGEEEEMDSSAALPKRHSRKRSAKNAHNTKAPMDEDCGCMGKGPKGKAACDGSCGGYAKKMDRNDALTPQEYLKACELGIHNRSRAYIRARLDSAARVDLKCGAGSISEGEKCTKGAGKAPANKESSVKHQLTNGFVSGAVKGAAAGPIAGFLAGKKTTLGEMGRASLSGAAIGGLMGAAQGLGTALGNRASNAISRKAARKPGRRDSVYAAGFSPELDQLAI